jgi:hypothetical protein
MKFSAVAQEFLFQILCPHVVMKMVISAAFGGKSPKTFSSNWDLFKKVACSAVMLEIVSAEKEIFLFYLCTF